MSTILYIGIAVLLLMGAVAYKVLVTMLADEVEGRLERAPAAVLRLVRRRLPEELRVPLCDNEWAPELEYILKSYEAVPIARFWEGMKFSANLLVQVRKSTKAAKPKVSLAARLAKTAKTVRVSAVRVGNGRYFAVVIAVVAGGIVTVITVAFGRLDSSIGDILMFVSTTATSTVMMTKVADEIGRWRHRRSRRLSANKKQP